MTNIVNGHDLDTQSGRADFRNEGGYVEGNSSGGGYTYQTPSGQVGQGGGTQAPTQGATFNTGSSGGGTPSNTVNRTSSNTSDLDALYQRILNAQAAGDAKALQEQIREFDARFGLDQQQLAENIRQFNQNYLIQQAGLTGTYNGQDTQAAILQANNIAAQIAGITGYYTNPNQGTGNLALDGFNTKASDSDRATYMQAEGGNVQAAAEHWLRDVTGAVRNAVTSAGGQYTTDSLRQYIYGQNAPQTTLANRLQQANIAAQQAQIYGTAPGYDANGNPLPTVAGTATLAAQNQAYTQQFNLAQLASQLQANPFRQAQVLGQANRILAGNPAPGFQAPQTVAGIGTVGGNTQGGMGYLQQIVDDIKNPTPNQTTADQFLANTPTPNKIDSASFLRATPTTQNIILQAMQEKYGLDPQDSLKQIQNTLPQFTAPTSLAGVRR